jgi:hypothetical protein
MSEVLIEGPAVERRIEAILSEPSGAGGGYGCEGVGWGAFCLVSCRSSY